MHIETENIRLTILSKRNEAVVLFKRELYITDVLEEVVEELSNAHFDGNVVFDMLLTKGVTEHYYRMQYCNNKFDYSSNAPLPNPTIDIIRISKAFYRSHPDFLIRTSLSSKQINSMRMWIEEV